MAAPFLLIQNSELRMMCCGRSCGVLMSHYALIVSYANKTVSLDRDESATSIPFGRSRLNLNRKRSLNIRNRRCPVRTGLPNGIPCPQEHALAGRYAFSILPALAGRRFRLAGQCFAFSSMCGVRKCVGFSVEEGGQTEWRWGS